MPPPYAHRSADPDPGVPGGEGFGARSYRPPQTFPDRSYGGSYGAMEPRGMSIAALILGAAAVLTGGLLILPQLLAVVFGHLALRREPAGRPLALAGLIMGYVMLLVGLLLVLGFVALLAFGTAAGVSTGA
ncbi:DUF4190 domain-containing protein [Arthrobacter sp. TMN-37]